MAAFYYLQSPDHKGIFTVHTEDCRIILPVHGRTYIGTFENCQEAIKSVTLLFPYRIFNGCVECCPECLYW
uniref:hypothetical protein n=1 Tax=uncultured Allobacillus sp. TaxID=1638025 RepID=UPI001642BA73|nr:hypothetical protein [uncultured Allobacillus sp.]